jgi:hypothetical protein
VSNLEAASYPVTFDLERPAKMGRAQVLLRILLLVFVSWIAGSSGGLGLVYLGFPVAAAILVSRKGGDRYLMEDGDRVTAWIAFTVGVLAYVALLTDELPSSGRQPVRITILKSGSPTASTALLRIVTAIPSALVLVVIGFVGWIVWLIAAISILLNERYPENLWNFQRGVVRWQARLLGYLASMVEPYPPFTFDTGPTPRSSGS